MGNFVLANLSSPSHDNFPGIICDVNGRGGVSCRVLPWCHCQLLFDNVWEIWG